MSAKAPGKKFHPDFWFYVKVFILAALGIFIIYPFYNIIIKSFFADGVSGITLANFAKFFQRKYYYSALLNSLQVCGYTVLFSTLIGIPISYLMTRYNVAGKHLMHILIIMMSIWPRSAMRLPSIRSASATARPNCKNVLDLEYSVCQQGSAQYNEDRIGRTEHCAWVIDGATDLFRLDLTGPNTDVSFTADALSRVLAADAEHFQSPAELLKQAAAEVRRRFPEEGRCLDRYPEYMA